MDRNGASSFNPFPYAYSPTALIQISIGWSSATAEIRQPNDYDPTCDCRCRQKTRTLPGRSTRVAASYSQRVRPTLPQAGQIFLQDTLNSRPLRKRQNELSTACLGRVRKIPRSNISLAKKPTRPRPKKQNRTNNSNHTLSTQISGRLPNGTWTFFIKVELIWAEDSPRSVKTLAQDFF